MDRYITLGELMRASELGFAILALGLIALFCNAQGTPTPGAPAQCSGPNCIQQPCPNCAVPATPLSAATGSGANSVTNAIISNICSTESAISTVILVLGLLLMVMGGALYAGSTILPGSSKGTLQGYGMGLILGGVIGVIISLVAPYILNLIVGNSVVALCS